MITDALRSVCDEGPRVAEDSLHVLYLGPMGYDEAMALQEELRERRAAGAVPDTFLLLEHPRVYTLGRAGRVEHLGAAANGPIPVRRVGRGGQVTYHGPGQLVGYGVVDLFRRGLDVCAYVRGLEEVMLRAAAACGVEAERRPGQPGVWVGPRKLGSVGIGIRRWITIHGFALNVTTDLAPFDAIVPCGLAGVRMTSFAAEGAHTSVRNVAETVAENLPGVMGYADVECFEAGPRMAAGPAAARRVGGEAT